MSLINKQSIMMASGFGLFSLPFEKDALAVSTKTGAVRGAKVAEAVKVVPVRVEELVWDAAVSRFKILICCV
jgi:hypothetical protein